MYFADTYGIAKRRALALIDEHGNDRQILVRDAGELDINTEIDRELAIAKALWGQPFELKRLEGSRGETLSDEELLELLRYFSDHGTVYSRMPASTDSKF